MEGDAKSDASDAKRRKTNGVQGGGEHAVGGGVGGGVVGGGGGDSDSGGGYGADGNIGLDSGRGGGGGSICVMRGRGGGGTTPKLYRGTRCDCSFCGPLDAQAFNLVIPTLQNVSDASPPHRHQTKLTDLRMARGAKVLEKVLASLLASLHSREEMFRNQPHTHLKSITPLIS